jgi:hypothetical protein
VPIRISCCEGPRLYCNEFELLVVKLKVVMFTKLQFVRIRIQVSQYLEE